MKHAKIIILISSCSPVAAMQHPPPEIQFSTIVLALHLALESQEPSRIVSLVPRLTDAYSTIHDAPRRAAVLAYIKKLLEYAITLASAQQKDADIIAQLRTLKNVHDAVRSIIELLTVPPPIPPKPPAQQHESDSDEWTEVEDPHKDWDKDSQHSGNSSP